MSCHNSCYNSKKPIKPKKTQNFANPDKYGPKQLINIKIQ